VPAKTQSIISLYVTLTDSSQSDTLQVNSHHSCNIHINTKLLKVLTYVELGVACPVYEELIQHSIIKIQ
ncbi:uncharacterized protein METZ01_LOCUS247345, partial [marine metagenome]